MIYLKWYMYILCKSICYKHLLFSNIILGWWPASTLTLVFTLNGECRRRGNLHFFVTMAEAEPPENEAIPKISKMIKHQGFHFSWKRLHIICLSIFLYLDAYIYIFIYAVSCPFLFAAILLGGEKNIVVGVEKQRQGQYSIFAGVAILWRSFEKGRC